MPDHDAPLGLMQPRALTVAHLLERLEGLFAHKTVTTGSPTGDETTTYAAVADGARRLATALDLLGVPTGARVGTVASNHRRHLELYLAVPSTKRVLHTLNIRLAAEHLELVVQHAEDDVVFVDRGLLASVWPSADRLPTVRHWVVMEDDTDAEVPDDPRVHAYDVLLASVEPVAGSLEDTFALADEHLAAGLCYTSGTTGPPKGVVYSHRSTVLHCLGTLAAGLVGIGERDVVMPVVPMFHAHAWGLPYAAMMAGADLVLPGRSADPTHLADLLERHRVTYTAAVPTVWTDVLPALDGRDLGDLRAVLGGGSPVSRALSEAYRATAGVPITHSWGMTEVSPVGAIGGTRTQHDDLDHEEQARVRDAQGQPLPLVRLRLGEPDRDAPAGADGHRAAELHVAGPWVASGYYRSDDHSAFTGDGWLRTGDLATLDGEGYLRIVDRVKDLIKSGGEWIPSVQLESAIATHPGVAEVAVVARTHERWGERPVAYVVAHDGHTVTEADIRRHLGPLVARWWLPDEVVLRTALPRTGSGKLAKAALRSP